MANDPRYDEILSALAIIKTKLPNGELEVIKKSIQSLEADQKAIKDDLEYFKKRLFNPDDGIVVRVNKNSESIDHFENIEDDMPVLKNRIYNLETWQGGVNKALWVVYSAVIGIIISLVFALLKK
jgi:hypothetical protein